MLSPHSPFANSLAGTPPAIHINSALMRSGRTIQTNISTGKDFQTPSTTIESRHYELQTPYKGIVTSPTVDGSRV